MEWKKVEYWYNKNLIRFAMCTVCFSHSVESWLGKGLTSSVFEWWFLFIQSEHSTPRWDEKNHHQFVAPLLNLAIHVFLEDKNKMASHHDLLQTPNHLVAVQGSGKNLRKIKQCYVMFLVLYTNYKKDWSKDEEEIFRDNKDWGGGLEDRDEGHVRLFLCQKIFNNLITQMELNFFIHVCMYSRLK